MALVIGGLLFTVGVISAVFVRRPWRILLGLLIACGVEYIDYRGYGSYLLLYSNRGHWQPMIVVSFILFFAGGVTLASTLRLLLSGEEKEPKPRQFHGTLKS